MDEITKKQILKDPWVLKHSINNRDMLIFIII